MKRILICPLDWGLGHATRCIQVIREIQNRGHQVMIASSGDALALLRLEFPELMTFNLPAYNPQYQKYGSLALSLLTQFSKFRKVIRSEHDEIEKIARENTIDVVISDNRYGCWSANVRSIIITHQTTPPLPSGFDWASAVANNLSGKYLSRFQQVWIPDQAASGLTTAFNKKNLPNTRYVGWLSRFSSGSITEGEHDLLAIVSGPEPQRSLFKEILISQLKEYEMKSLLVAGEPEKYNEEQMGNLRIVSHLSTPRLEMAMRSSNLILSRSGYSTVMDLIALGKKAVFIPTPQQPEQEMLADYCKAGGIAFSMKQNEFDLSTAIKVSEAYSGFSVFKPDTSWLNEALKTLHL